MKKLMALAALAMVALAIAPAQADPANGCYANADETGQGIGFPGAFQAGTSCSYTAGGNGQYVAATPNSWSIVVTYVDGSGTHERSRTEGELAPPSTGTFTAQAGDTVTITMGPDDAAGPVGGAIGILAAHDAA